MQSVTAGACVVLYAKGCQTRLVTGNLGGENKLSGPFLPLPLFFHHHYLEVLSSSLTSSDVYPRLECELEALTVACLACKRTIPPFSSVSSPLILHLFSFQS